MDLATSGESEAPGLRATGTLFAGLRLRKLELANRIVLAPMGQGCAVDGSATNWHYVHYGKFAASGIGLAIVEATCVERDGRFGDGTGNLGFML